jgi:ATP-dependent Clp endopeptidase proteolytic subunit ClpP
MSEEKELRTQKEINVDIALKEAEARKMEADAKNIEAMVRKNELEADKAAIELTFKQMDLVVKEEKRAKEKAADEENFVYRFGNSVTDGSVNSCVKKLTEWSRLNPKCNMEIIFSSPGGGIIEGFELFDHIQHLRNQGHHITTGTLGMAASMAGILLQAGDTRWIGQQAWLMIHRAAFGAYGKTFEIEDEVKFVKRIEERILDIFTSRSNLTRNKIKRNWERKDWWISAEESVELKLVDEVRAILPEHSVNKKKRRKKK